MRSFPVPKPARLASAFVSALAATLLLVPTPPAAAAEPQAVTAPLPETAVVFTGVENRVLWALRLLEDGKIARLLVSGIGEEVFLREFRLSPALATARGEGRLVLGTRAQSTLENAAETACWLTQEGLSGPILLITSQQHLPRATAALANAAPEVAVVTLGVRDPPGPDLRDNAASELGKLAVTRALRFLPESLSVREGFADCSGVAFR